MGGREALQLRCAARKKRPKWIGAELSRRERGAGLAGRKTRGAVAWYSNDLPCVRNAELQLQAEPRAEERVRD